MMYVGWKVLAYRYYHDEPGQQVPVSKEELLGIVSRGLVLYDWHVTGIITLAVERIR